MLIQMLKTHCGFDQALHAQRHAPRERQALHAQRQASLLSILKRLHEGQALYAQRVAKTPYLLFKYKLCVCVRPLTSCATIVEYF